MAGRKGHSQMEYPTQKLSSAISPEYPVDTFALAGIGSNVVELIGGEIAYPVHLERRLDLTVRACTSLIT